MRAGPSSLRRGTHTGPPSAVTQHAVEMTAGGQSSGDNGGAEAKASALPSGVLNDQVIRDRGLRRLVRTRLPSWGVESPAWREARRERTSGYVTDERQSQA
jgi:hypothetical protein